MPNFADQLVDAVSRKMTPVVVGLDPRVEQLPPAFQPRDRSPETVAEHLREFCVNVIDIVCERVAIVKPNAAFFEAWGVAGMQALVDVNRHAKSRGLLVLLDAKRGDIGSTAEAYAQAFLQQGNPWSSDALTVSPFLGNDTLEPLVRTAQENSTGLFVLVKTSNLGSADYQSAQFENRSNSERIAAWLESRCLDTLGEMGFGICGAVVGATYPQDLVSLRSIMPHAIFLIPGVGAQGARISEIGGAFDSRGLGALVNSSRGIIFAHTIKSFSHLNWERAVESAMTQLIDELADVTPVGKLRSSN
ncbi:MAG TPA: orotidine-5'-phosphate decarboxylase [Pirellulaceae bacterium]|nr:orotidine-5'-phosphate decarboxylase [Pirellulaceae bacterium]